MSPRGLTTHRMPAATGNLEIEVDLVGHRLRARTTDGEGTFDLVDGLSVAAFYAGSRRCSLGWACAPPSTPSPSASR